MKKILFLITWLFLSYDLFSETYMADILQPTHKDTIIPEDTICIPMSVSAKIIDSLIYLKQYERYSTICDSLLLENEKRANYFGSLTTHMKRQIDLLNESLDTCENQKILLNQRSLMWKDFSDKKDIEVQKLKKIVMKQRTTMIITGSLAIIIVIGVSVLAALL